MFRLLIVDDEPVIIDGLFELFREASQLNLDVCRACSGDEALDILEKVNVDIVLTDIKMPGISGLQLLDIIKQRWPKCRVIILTGYNEFGYVYKAIQYEGVNYLLKTEGYEKIMKAVEKYLSEIEQTIHDDELFSKVRYQLGAVMPILQKEFLSEILKGDLNRLTQKHLDELEISMNVEKPVLMLLCKINHLDRSNTESKTEVRYATRLTFEQNMNESIRFVNIMLRRTNMLWLLQPAELDSELRMYGSGEQEPYERIGLYVKRTLETVQNICSVTMNIQVSFAMENRPFMWDKLQERFNELDSLLSSRLDPNAEILIVDAGATSNVLEKVSPSLQAARSLTRIFAQFDTLESYLEHGMKTEFNSIFTDMQLQLYRICNGAYTLIMEVYARISFFFISYGNRYGLLEILAPDIEINRLFRIDQFGEWNDAFSYFEKLADNIFEVHKTENEKHSSTAISNIQKYVSEHLSEDLSLVRLGDQVYFSPQYLSRLFKQITGVNLISYINKMKLDKVKELLSNKDMKINEIGVTVGYLSAPYFSRFFKKATGITPQEYRDGISDKEVEKG